MHFSIHDKLILDWLRSYATLPQKEWPLDGSSVQQKANIWHRDKAVAQEDLAHSEVKLAACSPLHSSSHYSNSSTSVTSNRTNSALWLITWNLSRDSMTMEGTEICTRIERYQQSLTLLNRYISSITNINCHHALLESILLMLNNTTQS